MDTSTRAKWPGYRSSCGSTHDWKPAAPGPFHWVVYGPPDDDGMSDRSWGFADSREAAQQAIDDLVEASWKGVRSGSDSAPRPASSGLNAATSN